MPSFEQHINNLNTKTVDELRNLSMSFQALNWNSNEYPAGSRLSSLLQVFNDRINQAVGGSLLILVVGPVKSGKSTLVNLLADSYVSPTNYLECTLHPSIICRKAENTDEEIFSIHSTPDERDQKVVEIINEIRLGRPPVDTNTESTSLTIENVNAINEQLRNQLNGEIALNVYYSKGGNLLQQNVYLIDMPGLDGKNANWDNSSYEAIIREVDFVFFVQSSNSAITNISNDFFRKLHEVNPNVSICLIHNYFESSYWWPVERKNRQKEEQVQVAVDAIDTHFNISYAPNDLSVNEVFVLNLGKIDNYRKYTNGDTSFMDESFAGENSFTKSCKVESENFDAIQTALYNRLIGNEWLLHKNHCSRIIRQIKDVHEEIGRIKETETEYMRVETEIEGRYSDEEKIERLIGENPPADVDRLLDYTRKLYISWVDGKMVPKLGWEIPSISVSDANILVDKFRDECCRIIQVALRRKVKEVLKKLDDSKPDSNANSGNNVVSDSNVTSCIDYSCDYEFTISYRKFRGYLLTKNQLRNKIDAIVNQIKSELEIQYRRALSDELGKRKNMLIDYIRRKRNMEIWGCESVTNSDIDEMKKGIYQMFDLSQE